MIVCATTIAGFAQRTVTGKVVEQDTKDAVIQATASLLSGEKVVSNAVTNADGNFSVKAPSDGTFTLRITYVGLNCLLEGSGLVVAVYQYQDFL